MHGATIKTIKIGIARCKIAEWGLVMSCSFLITVTVMSLHFGDFSESNKKCFSL
jgi:hypothetical protein